MLPGGARYELKWDGYRVGVVCNAGTVRLWSRQGKNLTDRFPDLQAAIAAQVDVDLCGMRSWSAGTASGFYFDRLQRRLVTTPAKARQLVVDQLASVVAFDLLAVRGVDLRPRPWAARRQELEALAATWAPPLQLSPVTDRVDEGRQRLSQFRAPGDRGLVVATLRYRPFDRRRERGWMCRGRRDPPQTSSERYAYGVSAGGSQFRKR